MKRISRVIEELQAIQQERGDISVLAWDAHFTGETTNERDFNWMDEACVELRTIGACGTRVPVGVIES